MKIEIRETERLKAAREAEQAACDAFTAARAEVIQATSEASGVVPGKTMVSWYFDNRLVRGVVQCVGSMYGVTVRPILNSGNLGAPQRKGPSGLTLLAETWEGPWEKD